MRPRRGRQRRGRGQREVIARLPNPAETRSGRPQPGRARRRYRTARAGPGGRRAASMTRCASCGARNPSTGVASTLIGRLYEVGRDDDDEFGLVALEPLGAEQLPEDRDVAEPRELSRCSAGPCSAAARREQSSGRCRVRPSFRRDAPSAREFVRAVHGNRAGSGQLADLGADFQNQMLGVDDRRGDVERHAERLNSIVVVGTPLAVVEATGTGNSPPARKAAGCPLVAVRFGSASVTSRFSCASASSVACVRALSPPNSEAEQVLVRDQIVGYRIVGRISNAFGSRCADCRPASAPIDPERLQHLAVHLGHLDPDIHLVRRRDRHPVRHRALRLLRDRGWPDG